MISSHFKYIFDGWIPFWMMKSPDIFGGNPGDEMTFWVVPFVPPGCHTRASSEAVRSRGLTLDLVVLLAAGSMDWFKGKFTGNPHI